MLPQQPGDRSNFVSSVSSVHLIVPTMQAPLTASIAGTIAMHTQQAERWQTQQSKARFF